MSETLSEDTRDFWVDRRIPILDHPTSIEFMREAMSRYHPVIIRGLIDDWPALSKWCNSDYLFDSMGEKRLSINLTADGFADAVRQIHPNLIAPNSREHIDCSQRYFVYPAEHKMTMQEFYTLLKEKRKNLIPYLSQQNDNMRTEFNELLSDIITDIPLATDAFGMDALEAINLWIGDERSVSSLHKDHFENLYAVISGAKTFTLLPPTDIAFLPEAEYSTAKYQVVNKNEIDEEGLQLQLTCEGCPQERITWIDYDPAITTHHDNDVTKYTSAIHCTVMPGEVLFIPSMWYHRVSQTQLTAAVNFWYDQRFDFRFVFYQHIMREKEDRRKPNDDDD